MEENGVGGWWEMKGGDGIGFVIGLGIGGGEED